MDTARWLIRRSGAVQHGASTLPDEAFDRFPAIGTAEIHLATGFQNIIYDSPNLPKSLRNQIYDYLNENMASERKSTDTDEQFLYKTRKKRASAPSIMRCGICHRKPWRLSVRHWKPSPPSSLTN
jgi:hypothetical protein